MAVAVGSLCGCRLCGRALAVLVALVGVCRGMLAWPGASGIIVLPMVLRKNHMSRHAWVTVSGEFRTMTVALPHVAYVWACVSPQMLACMGRDAGD